VKIYRIARWVVLVALVLAVFLALRKPGELSHAQREPERTAHKQSFDSKLQQLEDARRQGESGTAIRLTADEVTSALANAQASPPGPSPSVQPMPAAATDQLPSVQQTQLAFESDVVRGQFLTQLSGQDVYVSVAGHLGSKAGYVTFAPTEFKIGDLNVPVWLVNDALQKKLAEQRDQLKLPDFVGDVRVENGELFITEK
jgi:hypothetical protein